MKPGLVHVAGEYTDLIQRCVVCGEILVDNRNAMVPVGSSAPKGFPRGPVTVIGNMAGAYEDEDLPRCKPI